MELIKQSTYIYISKYKATIKFLIRIIKLNVIYFYKYIL